MTPVPPNPPHEEFEARITALLLGELSATEEAVVREALAKDPALVQLHARLQQTIGLVGEAARSASEQTGTNAPTLRLPEERREKLLRSFKVIMPAPSFWSRWQGASMRDVSSVAAMFVVLGLLAWVLLFAPALERLKMMESVGEPDSGTDAEPAKRPSLTVMAGRRVESELSAKEELALSRGGRGTELAVAAKNFTVPAGVAPEENVGLGGPSGRSSFASRSDSKVFLPALPESASAGAEKDDFVNLWAEARPPTPPAGAVSDPQSARGLSVNAPAPARRGGVASTSGGMGGGGGAGGHEWFGQAAAQPKNFGWSFSRSIDQNGPASTLADGLAVDFTINPTPPLAATAAGSAQDNFYFNGREGRFDDAAKGKSDRSGVEATDAYAGVKVIAALGLPNADGGVAARPASPPASVPGAQSLHFGGVAGQPTALGESVQFYDYDTDGVAGSGEKLLAAKKPQAQELESLGRISGRQTLNESAFEKKQLAQVEDQMQRLPSLPTPESDARERELARFKAIDNLESRAGDKALTGANVQNGKLFLENGRLEEAESQLRAAIKLDPNNKSANYYLNLVQDKRNRNALSARADANNERLVKVEEAGNPPIKRNLTETAGDGLVAGKPVALAVVPAAAQPATPAGVISQEAVGFVNIKNGSELATVLKDVSQSAKGFGFDAASDEALKDAKPALQTSEPRFYRSRILLPEGRDSEERLKREPQVQTGPVSAGEVELRAQIKPVEKLAQLSEESASKARTTNDGRERLQRKLDTIRLGDVTYDSLPLGGVIDEINQRAAKKDEALRRPAPTAPIPQPEVATAENAFSTFSLNVSDVSFKLAAAALEKGQMPDPATVRSEEFINAFDYRDAEPAGSAPIAFAWERARYPFAHDRDLVRFSVKTAASGRQPGRPLNLVLLLDNSGSMERADRLRIRQECLRVLASQLQPQDRVSVVAFARTARLWVDGLPGNQASELPQRVGTLTPEGGTNLEDAMNLAYQTAQRHFLASGVNRVVLLTDGAANLGDVEPESLKKKVEAQRKQGIALDCFGIGWDGLNDELLEALSRNGDGRYGFVNTPEAAQDEFAGQLAGALKVAASDVKVQVEWNPRRVTAYRQIGYAKHQLKKEQFRDNTVDAAEIGAAEAGNALYTVQVNPRGEGPLGVVRVRFKVPGTTDYREHEWPLTYDGGARPLDQSTASLRLAATASAFSEWLVSSPYAAEVTPDKLLGLLGDVPETCGADPRPKKLEWMIRQAKSVAGK